jgi:integral membrane sensor domain MASE1
MAFLTGGIQTEMVTASTMRTTIAPIKAVQSIAMAALRMMEKTMSPMKTVQMTPAMVEMMTKTGMTTPPVAMAMATVVESEPLQDSIVVIDRDAEC